MSKKGKRKGVWSEVQTFTDKDSNLSVVVSERIRGRPEYSVQFVHHDKMGPNRYIPVPCEGAKHPFKDILFSLADAAEKYIAEKLAEHEAKTKDKPADKKPDKKGKPRREQKKPQGGLSTLAAKDAKEKGFEREGQTARKKSKGKR